jgi:hypothetical protein
MCFVAQSITFLELEDNDLCVCVTIDDFECIWSFLFIMKSEQSMGMLFFTPRTSKVVASDVAIDLQKPWHAYPPRCDRGILFPVIKT